MILAWLKSGCVKESVVEGERFVMNHFTFDVSEGDCWMLKDVNAGKTRLARLLREAIARE